MLDLKTLKGPGAAGNNPSQAKFTLSENARDRLRAASHVSGLDMSTIVELLIMNELAMPARRAGSEAKIEERKLEDQKPVFDEARFRAKAATKGENFID